MAGPEPLLNAESIKNPLVNRLFLIAASLQLFAAFVILGNEMMAVPGRYYEHHPIELQSSWMRVIAFVGVAVLSFLISLIMKRSKLLGRSLPLIFVPLVAAILTWLGTSVHYISILGWCCDPSTGFLFGFPFSFVYAISGRPLADLKFASHYGVFDLLSNPGLNILWGWNVDPTNLFLDFLFWINATAVVLYLLSLVVSTVRGVSQSTPKHNGTGADRA